MNRKLIGRMGGILAEMLGKRRFGREDFVILKTALMLAAVDGQVVAEEIRRFGELAQQCRGYSGKSFSVLWEQALRSAGYLLIQSQVLGQKELVALFVREAERDFVGTVALGTRKECVRAFEFLDRIATSDGDYSAVERAAIAALVKRVKAVHDQSVASRYSRGAKFDRRTGIR